MSFTLPDLPYDFNALEPHIDARTMEIHHGKHHGGYVAKLNAALEKTPGLQGRSIDELMGLLDTVPEEVRGAVRNNGGGHYNHSLFWKVLAPQGGGKPSGHLLETIEKSFGGFDAFRERFSAAAAGVFGSGWAWLVADASGRLAVETSPNQDNPAMAGRRPLLGLDVWEHAYYLKYQNRRPEYIEAFWNVVNWEQVAGNLRSSRE
ncbi:MAG: superoxide dismutase [Spirochaetota bacterium]